MTNVSMGRTWTFGGVVVDDLEAHDDRLTSGQLEVLNDLLEVNRDGYRGYELVADAAEDKELAQQFTQEKEKRYEFLRVLASYIVGAGGDPEEEGKLKAVFHRTWINVKSSLSDGDEALLNECIRGDTAAVEAYEEVLEKPTGSGFPQKIENTLQNQMVEIRSAMERWRSMTGS